MPNPYRTIVRRIGLIEDRGSRQLESSEVRYHARRTSFINVMRRKSLLCFIACFILFWILQEMMVRDKEQRNDSYLLSRFPM